MISISKLSDSSINTNTTYVLDKKQRASWHISTTEVPSCNIELYKMKIEERKYCNTKRITIRSNWARIKETQRTSSKLASVDKSSRKLRHQDVSNEVIKYEQIPWVMYSIHNHIHISCIDYQICQAQEQCQYNKLCSTNKVKHSSLKSKMENFSQSTSHIQQPS